jgi:rod shape-determining protein MreD
LIKRIVFSTLFILIAILLQSTLLYRLSFHYAVPDLALCVLVFTSYVNGTMDGQLVGFSGGVLLDFVSLSPLGLNMLIRSVIGFVFGILKGTFFLDAVFLPMALCAASTLVKALLVFLLSFLFQGVIQRYSFTTPAFWIELLLNTVLAPFIFGALSRFGSLIVKNKEN